MIRGKEAGPLALHNMTAHELRQKLDAGELSSRELTEAFLKRIEQLDGTLGAYLTVAAEEALEQARAFDEARANGEAIHPLGGIPVAVKDNLCTRGLRTTAASRMLENWVPPYDATVVERLRAARAPILGKTNMDEFAMGSSTETSAFKVARNPWDLDRVPGGSSGGSAIAVAAGLAVWSLGSDTGGSIRQPAAYCGVVGMKPTYGRVSRYGLLPFASSLDQIGPFTLDVTDCALALSLISGFDPRDSTSVDMEVPDYAAALRAEAKGLRIGIPVEYMSQPIDGDVRAAVEGALKLLEENGAQLKEVSLPSTRYAVQTYYMIAPAEASSNLARYDGVRYGLRVPAADVPRMMEETRSRGFGPEVKRRIILGTYVLSAGHYDAYYKKASQVRTLIRRDFERAFGEVDVLIAPTTPTTAFRLGDKTQDPLAMYMMDIFTIPVNLAGLPGLAMPCGVDRQGLPVGLQIIGPPFREDLVLRAAYTYEQLAWPQGAGRHWRAGREVAVDVR